MSVQTVPSSISGADLREVMRRVPTPVTVVTAAGPSQARGITIGSFTSVSLNPPLVSFNVDKESQMHEVLAATDHFAVHILGEEQSELSTHFAIPDQSGTDQLNAVTYERAEPHGTPILEAAPAVLHCRPHETFGAGDHTIVVGRVIRVDERTEASPILYYDRGYRGVTPQSNQAK